MQQKKKKKKKKKKNNLKQTTHTQRKKKEEKEEKEKKNINTLLIGIQMLSGKLSSVIISIITLSLLKLRSIA